MTFVLVKPALINRCKVYQKIYQFKSKQITEMKP